MFTFGLKIKYSRDWHGSCTLRAACERKPLAVRALVNGSAEWVGFAELGEGGGLVMMMGRDSRREELGQGSRVLQAAPPSHAGEHGYQGQGSCR